MDKNYITNTVLNSPGLAIKASSGVLVKAVTAFAAKAKGVISTLTSANTDMPSLATSLGRGSVASAVLADDMCRIYTFLAAVNATSGALTYSVVHGEDFSISRRPLTEDINFGNTDADSEKAVVGFLFVKNETGAEFVPGTTALDAANLTTQYVNGFGFIGM